MQLFKNFLSRRSRGNEALINFRLPTADFLVSASSRRLLLFD
jgi:hypothetical protein